MYIYVREMSVKYCSHKCIYVHLYVHYFPIQYLNAGFVFHYEFDSKCIFTGLN